jgi:ribonuclease-3
MTSTTQQDYCDEERYYRVLNNNNMPFEFKNLMYILKLGGLHDFIEVKNIKDLTLWQQAFIHKSYCIKDKTIDINDVHEYIDNNHDILTKDSNISKINFNTIIDIKENNYDTIEFLGDGFIQGIIGNYLTLRYPDQDEGFLTTMRSKLVKTKPLAFLAKKLGMHKFIIMSRHVEEVLHGRTNSRLLEDSFEAFVGVIYRYFSNISEPYGYIMTSRFIINVFEKYIDFVELILTDDNYKTKLMNYYQDNFNDTFPTYVEISSEGASNDRIFTMGVKNNKGDIVGQGVAKSKKQAEQIAAKNALDFFINK